MQQHALSHIAVAVHFCSRRAVVMALSSKMRGTVNQLHRQGNLLKFAQHLISRSVGIIAAALQSFSAVETGGLHVQANVDVSNDVLDRICRMTLFRDIDTWSSSHELSIKEVLRWKDPAAKRLQELVDRLTKR